MVFEILLKHLQIFLAVSAHLYQPQKAPLNVAYHVL